MSSSNGFQTERKASEAKYRGLLEAAPDGMVVVNQDGEIVLLNARAEKQFGYRRDELLGQKVTNIIPEGFAERLIADGTRTAAEALAQQIGTGIELCGLRKDGSEFPIEIMLSPLESAEGILVTAAIRDITERKAAESALKEAVKKYRAIFDGAQEGMFQFSSDGGLLSANPYLAKMLGYDSLEGVFSTVKDVALEAWAYPDECARFMQEIDEHATIQGFECQFKRKGSSNIWVSLNARKVFGDDGQLLYYEGFATDITKRKVAEDDLYRSRKLLQYILDTIPQRVFWKDRNSTYLGCNQALATDAGLNNPAEIIGKNDFELAWSGTAECYRADDNLVMEKGTARLNYDETQSRPDGRLIWLRTSKLPLHDQEGKVTGIIGTYEDITERKVSEERIRFLAYYDALTGLPNRTLLQDRLTKALASAIRRKEKVALLFLDLDRFKDINDSFGHPFGDLLLQKVAERVKSGVRKQDSLGRLGSDEFLIVLTNVKEIAYARVAAERFMQAMSAKFVIQGHSLIISCCVGISMFPEDGMDSESLLRNADAAMYSAKKSGRNNFRFFTEDMNTQAVERVTLENDLRQALDKKELFLVYQPQINIATGKIIGLEALLRWQHPTLGLISPDRFIRIAENCGLIIPIGEWVLRTACAQVRKWQDEGIPAVSIAINVSTVQFCQGDFCELIRRVLNETGLDPHYLELELTESIFLVDADVTLPEIQKLEAMVLTLAIDDFGTGYCNFNYLRQFKISKLKIDRSFIRDIAVNSDNVAITTAIISMAKSLSIKVLAEGVEDEAQMSFLRAHQCDEIQGYYFSKPLAVDKVADKLRGNSPKPQVRAQASGA